jgi:hypothetical protein
VRVGGISWLIFFSGFSGSIAFGGRRERGRREVETVANKLNIGSFMVEENFSSFS